MKYFALACVLRNIFFKNYILCTELNNIPVKLENLQSSQIRQEDVLQALKSTLEDFKLREDYNDNEQSNDLQLNTSEISEKINVKKIVNNEDVPGNNLFAVNEEENDSLNVEVGSDSYDKGSVIKDEDDDDTLEVQRKNNSQSTSLEIAMLFQLLKSEISEMSNFYIHYDVLIIIEKCISLINKFQSSFNFNGKNNAMVLRRSIKNIDGVIKNYDRLFLEVKQIYLKKKEDNPNSSDFDHIWDGLINLDYRTSFLKEEFDRHKNFDVENFNSFTKTKYKKLTNLEEHLTTIKDNISKIEEDKIKEYANSLKNNYINIINEIHEELFKYNEKEKGSLSFLFDFMNEIWRSIGKCIDDLESFKRSLNEK